MSGLAGILNISDTERAFVNTVGQQVVFDAVNQLLSDYNAEVAAQTAVFIEKETEKFKLRYLLPGGGKLQRMGRQAPAGAMKRYGYYDVAFPLRQWGAELAGDRVDMAYMSIAELDAHLDTIMIQDLNTLRWRILTSIFENTNLTFTDPIHGSLTVRRLANTDGSTYPPVVGSESEADDDHYIDAGYAVSAISSTNDPVATLRDEIAEHFGGIGTSGRNFVYFHANDQLQYLQAITGYVAVTDRYLQVGHQDIAEVSGWPRVPGRIHGRYNGAWLSEWDGWIPDKYGIMALLDVPAPLQKRVDPSDTGLGRGLQLVATDTNHPMQRASYEHRYGLGCGNRLSAACIYINGANGGYEPPSAYSE
ncbi:MAG: hypothetical protein SXV54_13960 [Chloroflexota bacterium]|nr:hypothetical protein [Chloroflexota bacterium]